VLIFLIFISLLISFLNYITPTLILQLNCDTLVSGDEPDKVVIMSLERLVTHFIPVGFSMFVFWRGREKESVDTVFVI
jgi:hypothetical protein